MVLAKFRKLERMAKRALNQLFSPAARAVCKKLVITYDADFKNDGTGAQLQRQFAVLVLARVLGCSYQFSPIRNVAVHALDPFQTETAYLDFLEKLNYDFELSSELDLPKEIPRVIRLASPSILALIGVGLGTLFFKGLTLVKVGEPYLITENFQDTYETVWPNLLNWSCPEGAEKVKTVAIHYRQGVGGKAIYPGQKIPRELDLEYFIEVIQYIARDNPKAELKLVVLTDAPSIATTYTPPNNQQMLWEGTPGFRNGEMLIIPFDFSPLKILPHDFEIISGGDPVDAIRIMSTADFLLMGRSSLSFVAGVLNQKGVVFTAPDFWHNPLSRWTSYTDSVLKSQQNSSK
jgi:hypothetical protein